MSILLLLAVQVSLDGLPQDTAEGCTDREGTTALSSCYSERNDAWEQRLQAAYPIALSHTRGTQRVALQRSQVAWRRYRSASCAFYDGEAGSIHLIWGAYCMLDLTRRRALELERYVLP